ncbi:MAG: hypothetical protein R3D67_03230 [Hyphomicrobiaceae bacterium]
MPNIAVVAANANGEIVRYWEAGETAAYFGSPFARDASSGRYDPSHEQRRIASTGKMLVAIAAGNWSNDTPSTLYVDPSAPARGLETCARGHGTLHRGRHAIVAFACSLSPAIEWRGARLGQARIRRLIDGFGFTMPPPDANGEGVPESTAAARGLISGSPRRVHHMAGVILAAMTGRGGRPLQAPTLVKAWELSAHGAREGASRDGAIIPNTLIRSKAVPFLKSVLSAPLCYEAGGRRHGTLKSLGSWCATRNSRVSLHFAKTGTDTNEDANQTIDTWIAGGVRFSNGEAYSYVIEIGTGSTQSPFASRLNAGALLGPLADALLTDLAPKGVPARTAARTATTTR